MYCDSLQDVLQLFLKVVSIHQLVKLELTEAHFNQYDGGKTRIVKTPFEMRGKNKMSECHVILMSQYARFYLTRGGMTQWTSRFSSLPHPQKQPQKHRYRTFVQMMELQEPSVELETENKL